MTKMTKVMAAKQIVETNPNATRSEIVQMFMDKLGMSKAGATTYGYNLAKNAAKVRTKREKPVREIVINEEATKILHENVTVLPGIPEAWTAEQEAEFDEVAAKLKAKREKDALRKREKRAAEKAAKAALAA